MTEFDNGDIEDVSNDIEFEVFRIIRDKLARSKVETVGGDAGDIIIAENVNIKEIVEKCHQAYKNFFTHKS